MQANGLPGDDFPGKVIQNKAVGGGTHLVTAVFSDPRGSDKRLVAQPNQLAGQGLALGCRAADHRPKKV